MGREKSCHSGGNRMTAALAIRHDLEARLPAALQAIAEPCKVLAFKARVSKRTMESARRGEHLLSAPALLELARAFPEVRALVLELIGAPERDPARILEEIRKMVSK